MKKLLYGICIVIITAMIFSCGKKSPPVLKDYDANQNSRQDRSE